VGACPSCEGYGKIIGIDPDLVVPNKNLSVYEDAVACWKGEKLSDWKRAFVLNVAKLDFPIHKPYYKLSAAEKQLLWKGARNVQGIDAFFEMLDSDKHKIQNRVMLARYRGKTLCTTCQGTRLKPEASYVKVGNKTVSEMVDLPLWDIQVFFEQLVLDEFDEKIAKRILIEIRSRLKFLCEVGLGYLTLNRLSSSLSGGESQRINLATSLGSSLVGSLYILDEPSIGLHSRDTERLISVLKGLKSLGNTVLVVEHDEDIMLAADTIIDIGPHAGRLGGELVFQGNHAAIFVSETSLTGKYLSKRMEIAIPATRRAWKHSVSIKGAYLHNLKNIDVEFPLSVLTAITGVSGSGKSSLVRDIVYQALLNHVSDSGKNTKDFVEISGSLDRIGHVEFVDQNPIGRSSRSNPVTYIKAYDEIRKLFSDQQAAIINGFKPAHFSFNVEGGRCEECQGDGEIKIEMQFMADVHLLCESCGGKRFKDEVLEVLYQGKSIFDVLELTVDESITFFGNQKGNTEQKIVNKLNTLADVGLGYVKLGQSSSTLSGGESQRIKLASFLTKERSDLSTVFIFDEPTTGLHFHDINKLLAAFQALINRGNSIFVIEHNLDVVKCADWVIDLGPEGGQAGGNLVFAGTPEDLIKCPSSYTAHYLKDKLKS
jgi:excinuclease ABC subunit A